jgi:hypothetical protein
MVKALKLAAVSAIFLVPFAYPHGALAWTARTYEEAVWLCSVGNLQACDLVYAYETAGSSTSGGGPADQWVGPEDLRRGGLGGVRRGPLSTDDFIR